MERVASTAKSATMVTVACKLPNGLMLQCYDMIESFELSPQGKIPTRIARKYGEPVKLNGTAVRFGQIPEYRIAFGYAMTQVPADFWERWCRENQDADVLKNKLIFAHVEPASTDAKAKEAHAAKVRSGMEPIDPRNPPSVGGGLKVTSAVAGNA